MNVIITREDAQALGAYLAKIKEASATVPGLPIPEYPNVAATDFVTLAETLSAQVNPEAISFDGTATSIQISISPEMARRFFALSGEYLDLIVDLAFIAMPLVRTLKRGWSKIQGSVDTLNSWMLRKQ